MLLDELPHVVVLVLISVIWVDFDFGCFFWHQTFAESVGFDLLKSVVLSLVGAVSISVDIMAQGVVKWVFLLTSFDIVA